MLAAIVSFVVSPETIPSHHVQGGEKNTEFTEFLLEGKGEDEIDNTTK